MLRSRTGFGLVVGDRKRLGLSPSVHVDLHAATQWCRWLMSHQFSEDSVAAVPDWVVTLTSQSILTDWDSDSSWVYPVQTQWDVLRREVQSGLAQGLLSLGKFDQAVICAFGLIQQDPLHEAAWEVLIEALLSSGRRAEARMQFTRLSDLLRSELGVDPRPATHRLVERMYRTG